MEIWQQIMDFTTQNAAHVRQSQWNMNYLEVVGTSFEATQKIDEICKRIPKLRVETRTRYVKPRAESKLGVNFRYTPPKRSTSASKLRRTTVVSLKVVVPKEEQSLPARNCFCTCERNDGNRKGNSDGDDDISLDTLLEAIKRLDEGKTSGKALRNLSRGYQGNVTLDEDNVKKILMMLDSSDKDVQEALLVVIHRLSQVFVNARLFLMHGVLDDLIYLMLMGSTDQIQTLAAQCIAKLTDHETFSKLWMETMVISGTEALFDVLGAEGGSEELHNAVLEAIGNIANNEKMAAKLVDFGLDTVIQLIGSKTDKENLSASIKTQRLAIKALSNILSHNCTLVEQFVEKYSDAVAEIVEILQFGKCPEQQEAARFLATLTLFNPSIESIISHHATQHLLWAMTCSHCRFVREYTSKAFKNISKNNDKEKLFEALSQFTMSQVTPTDKVPNPNSPTAMSEILSKTSMQDTTNKVINTVKKQISCTSIEKIMVEVFAIVCLSFQTDALHLSGESRTLRSNLQTRGRSRDSGVSDKYVSSLKVLCNTLVAVEALLGFKDKDQACSAETSLNLKLASLYVQCGGLNFINQLKFLSTRLQSVNSPSFHCIDPTTLPPKDLISSLKNARTQLIFQEPKRPNPPSLYPDFGFHREEVNFVQQALSLLTVLGQVIAPDYDPALEDLKIFAYRRQMGKKRHISFRTSALLVKSAVKMGKLNSQVGIIEEKPVVSRKKSTAARKMSHRPASRTKSADSAYSGASSGHLTTPPVTAIEPGTTSNCEMVHFVKQSILNSKVVSHLACWVTCGVYDIQINVLKVLRYLMHISPVTKQATDSGSQAPNGESQQAWGLKRTAILNPGGQRYSVVNSAPKTKSKSTHLGHLFTRHVIQYCGPYLLDLLMPQIKGGLGRMSLMVIKECAVNGESDSRVKLVKLGCFAQIIDYIRGTEDEPDIQSICLVVLRSLVSSDQALKQLFLAHGGMSLVMALHEYKQGVVKEQAAFTLTAFSKGSTLTGKPKGLTHTKKRHKKSSSADDIWDHVTQKWEGQDKVSKLLKSFNVRY